MNEHICEHLADTLLIPLAQYPKLETYSSKMGLFLRWIDGKGNVSDAEIQAMFLERQFAPLPLHLKQEQWIRVTDMMKAVSEQLPQAGQAPSILSFNL
jgi:hypothetical protein